MKSSNGNDVPNQFTIRVKTENENQVAFDEIYFQSYNSIIAKKDFDGSITLDKNTWDYSTTTGKYRNQFLGEGIAETRKKIENGTYLLVDLN